MKKTKIELSSEQTLRLAELRDALAKAVPADTAETFEFPVAQNACRCGCTVNYYVTCSTSCYMGCKGTAKCSVCKDSAQNSGCGGGNCVAECQNNCCVGGSCFCTGHG